MESWTIGIDGKKESRDSVFLAQQDDNDDDLLIKFEFCLTAYQKG